jgi:hypothetical protein
MGMLRYGVAVALGYALGRPEGRERLGQVGRQAAELRKRPEVAQLRERGKSAAADGMKAVKQKVATRTGDAGTETAAGSAGAGGTTARHRRGLRLPAGRLPFSRSRDVHFPDSEGVTAPVSLGGTTVMEDSEAAVLGTPVTPHAEPSTSTDRPV